MSRWERYADAFGRWTVRRKWEYRILWSSLMAYLIYNQLTNDWGKHWVDYVLTGSTVMFAAGIIYLWWRQDVLDEFEERARAAIGRDASIVILCARLRLRTITIAKLNRVMRRYDVMSVPFLDLPPEAKELREIMESVRRR